MIHVKHKWDNAGIREHAQKKEVADKGIGVGRSENVKRICLDKRWSSEEDSNEIGTCSSNEEEAIKMDLLGNGEKQES